MYVCAYATIIPHVCPYTYSTDQKSFCTCYKLSTMYGILGVVVNKEK